MARIRYTLYTKSELTDAEMQLLYHLRDNKIIEVVENNKSIIIGRYHTNKLTLRKLLKNG